MGQLRDRMVRWATDFSLIFSLQNCLSILGVIMPPLL